MLVYRTLLQALVAFEAVAPAPESHHIDELGCYAWRIIPGLVSG